MKRLRQMTALYRRLTPLVILLAGFAVGPAFASACSNPAGNEQDFIYNGNYHTYQFCNGTNWVVAGGTVAPESLATQTIGLTFIQTQGDSGEGNYLLAQEATLPYASTIESISFWVTAAAGNLILGIYDATGPSGGPGNLVATTAGFAPTANSWNTANVVTPVVLAAGNYWLAYNPSSSLTFLNNGGATGNCAYYSYTYSGALPATFSTAPSSCTPALWDFYATFTATGCGSPAGKERDIIYNGGSHTLQFCNGGAWITMGQGSGGGGGGCSSPAGKERDIIYSSAYHTYQFCNGTNWVKYGGKLWQGGQPTSDTVGYFVMSKSTWTGDLQDAAGIHTDGLTAANALCLTELTTNTGWKGYAAANANGQLVSGKVHAWLCEGSGCNNLNANTTYYFADANNGAHGGNRFTTDSTGDGPGYEADWSQASYFGTNYQYWAGARSDGSNVDFWETGEYTTNGHCDNGSTYWSSTSNVNGCTGVAGATNIAGTAYPYVGEYGGTGTAAMLMYLAAIRTTSFAT
jgi:hypothetical protein